MGNVGSNSSNERRRHGGGRRRRGHHHHNHPPPLQQTQPEITANLYVFAAATPYPAHYTNPPPPPPPYYQYRAGAYYPPPLPPPAMPFPAAWRYPCGPVMQGPTPYVDHQKAVTIKNDVNLKKESLKIEEDEENPGKFLVSFIFDASLAGSITLYFFAKEENNCTLTSTKQDSYPPIMVNFDRGLAQKFRQKPGTGIGLSAFDEAELSSKGETDIYPLAVKAEATPSVSGDTNSQITNAQITQVTFEKVKGEFRARVTKQILWVNGMRYELQEIYGIGNSVDFDGNDSGKECVVCLSEPRDTTVLPCRHMCLCGECAKILRFQTNRCPICRQPIERLLEIKVNYGTRD